MPEVSGKARHSCARHRFGGQGTARPTCAAWRCRGGCVNRLSCVGRRSVRVRSRVDVDSRERRRPSVREQVKRPTIYFALRRYAIGERVGVKIGVITQTVPWTILLGVWPTLFFSPLAKSSHELYRAMARNVQSAPSRCCINTLPAVVSSAALGNSPSIFSNCSRWPGAGR